MAKSAPGYSDAFKDYNGEDVTVDWNERLWESHSRKHHLQSYENTSRLISEALVEPDVVMQGIRPGGTEETRIFYKEIKCHQHFVTFTKVVCLIDERGICVKTVYQEQAEAAYVVRERAYASFKEVWKTSQTKIY